MWLLSCDLHVKCSDSFQVAFFFLLCIQVKAKWNQMGISRQNKRSWGHKLYFTKAKAVSTWDTCLCLQVILSVCSPCVIVTDLYPCRNKSNETRVSKVAQTLQNSWVYYEKWRASCPAHEYSLYAFKHCCFQLLQAAILKNVSILWWINSPCTALESQRNNSYPQTSFVLAKMILQLMCCHPASWLILT